MSNTRFQLVLVRHGHTEWNLTNRFTGWSDIPLSETGANEAKQIGLALSAAGFTFDEAHVSALTRTRQSLDAILTAANHPNVPVYTSWRLNERHYGDLQGMNKQEIFAAWGEEQSYKWWRGYDAEPPPIALDDPRHPRFETQYNDIDVELLPRSESLAQCLKRLQPYWQDILFPRIKSGQRIIVVSHGNTLRSLRKIVENISTRELEKVEIPFDIPFVYSFNEEMNVTQVDWLETKNLS